MNRDDPFISQVESYLHEHEGPTPLPDSVRTAVRFALPRTRQVRPLPSFVRSGAMVLHLPTPARVGLVAALVVALSVAGGLLFLPGRTGPGQPPTASPTASPTGEPSVSAAPFTGVPAGAVPAGTYALDFVAYNKRMPRRLFFTVPDGWNKFEGQLPALITGGPDGGPPAGAGVTFWTVDNVMADPCQPSRGEADPRVGPAPAALVAALLQVPGYEATEPVETALGGVPATYVELTATSDTSACEDASLKLWTSSGNQYGQVAGQQNRIWVVDLDGFRLVIAAFQHAGTSAADQAEITAMVEAITFVRR